MATSNKTGATPYVKPVLSPIKAESSHRYFSPGEKVGWKGVTYLVKEGKHCKDCSFYREGFCDKPRSFTECCGYSRPDKTWIIFVRED